MIKKATNVVTREAIEELGKFARASARQVVPEEEKPVVEDQVKIDLERLKRLEEEMAILRKKRQDNSDKRIEENTEDQDQFETQTIPKQGPKKSGEQIKKRN